MKWCLYWLIHVYDTSCCVSKTLWGPTKIVKPASFQALFPGIGKSFQSAITGPQINLTGYGNATAQSWLFSTGIEFYSKASLSSMWDVTFQSRSWLVRMSITMFVLLYCAVRFIKNVDRFYLAVVYSERQTSSRTVFLQCAWQLRLV